MSRHNRDRKRQAPDGFNCPEDVEFHAVALPESSEGAALVRERYQSRQWWTLLCFGNDTTACKIVADLEAAVPVQDGWELVKWPIKRMSASLGVKDDHLIVAFARKTVVTAQQLTVIVNKHTSEFVAIPDNLDLLPLSWGYRRALMNALEGILRSHAHHDN